MLGWRTVTDEKTRKDEQWWPTPVILPTWEVEIGRFMVRGQFRQIVNMIQNNQTKMHWRYDLHCRVPAFQVQSPEVKSQFYPPKKPPKTFNSYVATLDFLSWSEVRWDSDFPLVSFPAHASHGSQWSIENSTLTLPTPLLNPRSRPPTAHYLQKEVHAPLAATQTLQTLPTTASPDLWPSLMPTHPI